MEDIIHQIFGYSHTIPSQFSKKHRDIIKFFMGEIKKSIYHITNHPWTEMTEMTETTSSVNEKKNWKTCALLFPSLLMTTVIENMDNHVCKTTHFLFETRNRKYNIYITLPQYSLSHRGRGEGEEGEGEGEEGKGEGEDDDPIKMCMKICSWLVFIDPYSSPTCSRDVNIHIYLARIPKRMSSSHGKTMSSMDVNSAFTTGCLKSTEIWLFRREEWYKVFIHECFHTLGLDFSNMSILLSNVEIKKIFPVKCTNLRIYEAYAECWAEFMYIIFIVFFSVSSLSLSSNIETEITEKELNILCDEIETRIFYEKQWSMFQCVKVLHFFNLSYSTLIESVESYESKIKLHQQYNETDTHILSYYILKSILIFHIDEFIEWCIENNVENIFNFTKTDQNVISFVHLFKILYKSPKFLHGISIVEAWMNTNTYISNYENTNRIWSMRMTIT
jgi:hypothetical protein